MKKTNALILTLILFTSIIIAAIIGVLIWVFVLAANNNTTPPNLNSCLLYSTHSAEKVDLSRPNDSQELLNQFNNFGILENQGISSSSITTADRNFILTCENDMTYQADTSAVSKFNSYSATQSIASIDEAITALTNNTFYKYELKEIINQASITEQNDLTNQLIYFYNILYNLYGADLVNHLLYNFELASTQDNVVAYTRLGIFTGNLLQCQVYGSSSVDMSTIDNNYNVGWWSSDNIISVIVHETGHALENYSWVIPSDRNRLNTNANSQSGTCSNFSGTGSTNVRVFAVQPNNYLVNYLGEKVGISDNYSLEQQLAAWSFIQSGYGRYGVKGSGGNRELFAEAFAQWLLTPNSKRGLNWQILNDFFTSEIISKYQIN